MNIYMHSVNFTTDKKLSDYIEVKLKKLERFFGRIIRADVSLKLENSGQIRDKIIILNLQVPGQNLNVSHTSKTFETAVDGAVKSLKRRVIKYKDKLANR